MVNGRRYKWLYNPQFGPLFWRGDDYKWVPNRRHPVWGKFEKWVRRVK
jgi:hypothetical protein